MRHREQHDARRGLSFARRALTFACGFFLLLAAFAVAHPLAYPTVAHAETSAFDDGDTVFVYRDDTTGNVFSVNHTIEGITAKTDLYWTGMELNSSNVTVGSEALIAGKELTLSDSTIGGSLRMAGDHVFVRNTRIGDNLSLGGAQVVMEEGSSARSVQAVGILIEVNGTCQTAHLSGSRVSIGGHIEGDVIIDSRHVTITKDAVIDGTVTLTQVGQQFIDDDAQIGTLVQETPEEAMIQSTGDLVQRIVVALWAVIAYVLVTLLFSRVLNRFLSMASYVVNDRPAPVALLGFWVSISLPFVAFFLVAFVVTIPLSVILVVLMVVQWCFAVPLTSAIVGRVVSETFLHDRLEKTVGCALSALLTVVTYVPFLFSGVVFTLALVPTLCTVLNVGVIVQVMLQHRNDRLWAEGRPSRAWLGGPFGGGRERDYDDDWGHELRDYAQPIIRQQVEESRERKRQKELEKALRARQKEQRRKDRERNRDRKSRKK